MSNNHSRAINLARRLSAQNEPDLLRTYTFFVLSTIFRAHCFFMGSGRGLVLAVATNDQLIIPDTVHFISHYF